MCVYTTPNYILMLVAIVFWGLFLFKAFKEIALVWNLWQIRAISFHFGFVLWIWQIIRFWQYSMRSVLTWMLEIRQVSSLKWHKLQLCFSGQVAESLIIWCQIIPKYRYERMSIIEILEVVWKLADGNIIRQKISILKIVYITNKKIDHSLYD